MLLERVGEQVADTSYFSDMSWSDNSEHCTTDFMSTPLWIEIHLRITFKYAFFRKCTAENHTILSTNQIHFRFSDLAHFSEAKSHLFSYL